VLRLFWKYSKRELLGGFCERAEDYLTESIVLYSHLSPKLC
jgi:hypothetical protein